MDSVQSMASSSSSTVPSSERTSHFSSHTEMEMESSKTRHWSQLDYPTTDLEGLAESNLKYFALLKEDPRWSRFFTDFEALEVGEKISGGAQADIYEARNTRDGPFNLVVKVMHGDAPLKTFHAQWPFGLLSARSKYKHLFDLPLITILGGTMLRDQRLRGRFAFVMYRRWGDLRLLIDRRMKQECNKLGPFTIDEAIHLMSSIAEDMDTLHTKHDILHRDLKASNVLVWGEFGEGINLTVTSNRVAKIGSVVADFECSVGVLGTRFWRAPEILEQCKARMPSAKVQFTRASDVYSYGMLCYEIVTGCIPYDGCGGQDMISQILDGRRPELPHELPEFVRSIIFGCWHSEPAQRPSFSAICMALKLKKGPNPVSVVIDNKSESGSSIVKVEKWNNPQALTLLEVMQKLMDMDLSILKASDSSSAIMISQYFEVIDCKGRKVVNDKSIANITKALNLIVKRECICENVKTSIYENTIVQMHVLEVIAKWSAGLFATISKLLAATNFRAHSAGCCTREGRVDCVIYVEGTRMGTLLWELRHNMEYFPISPGSFKIIVHKVSTEGFLHLNKRLQNLKSMDLTLLPRNTSNLCVHLWKISEESKEFEEFEEFEKFDEFEESGKSEKSEDSEESKDSEELEESEKLENFFKMGESTESEELEESEKLENFVEIGESTESEEFEESEESKKAEESFCSTSEVIVCLENRRPVVNVSRRLCYLNYKICRASIADYPVSYEFLMDRIDKRKDNNVKTVVDVDKDEWKKLDTILNIAEERKCLETNMELSVFGPSKVLHHDLMRSFWLNDLVVTGGQLYRGGWEYGTELFVRSGELIFVIIEKSTVGAN